MPWCLTRRQPDPIHCHKQLQDSIDYPILLLSSATTVSQPTIYYCVLLFDNFNLQTIVYFYLQINLIFHLLSYNNSLLLYENFFMNVRKVKHTMRKEYKESRIARINEDFQGSLSPQPPLPYIYNLAGNLESKQIFLDCILFGSRSYFMCRMCVLSKHNSQLSWISYRKMQINIQDYYLLFIEMQFI